jgi:membrane associated rhomboid family serine protease
MDDAPRPGPSPDPRATGRLSRDAAVTLLQRGDDLLAAGEFADASAHFLRVVGYDDPAITAAGLLGLGEAHYRLNDEDAAVQAWTSILQLPETPSTYPAWRNIAAARVRAGDLPGALDAYRQADRRAPPEDKAEIANRLGWLSKETGDRRASQRYFARGRGDSPFLSMTVLVIAVTTVISLTALFSSEGDQLYKWLQLDKAAVAAGEYWRLWSVTLLHANLLHLGFNMYALWLAGSIVERWYGPWRFLAFYLACAAAGSTASFMSGGNVPAVGASGAIFGMFGVLITAARFHHPVDPQSRGLVGQMVVLVVINLVLNLGMPEVDIWAHIGGLAAGLWLGAIVPPTSVRTLASLWQQPVDGVRVPATARAPVTVVALGLVVVGVAVVAGIAYGTTTREGTRPNGPIAEIRADTPKSPPGSAPIAIERVRPG